MVRATGGYISPLMASMSCKAGLSRYKGGKNVTIADLRALRSVLENEEALMAGLIIMEPFGARKMQSLQQFANEAGDLEIVRFGAAIPEDTDSICTRNLGGQAVRYAYRDGQGSTSANQSGPLSLCETA